MKLAVISTNTSPGKNVRKPNKLYWFTKALINIACNKIIMQAMILQRIKQSPEPKKPAIHPNTGIGFSAIYMPDEPDRNVFIHDKTTAITIKNRVASLFFFMCETKTNYLFNELIKITYTTFC